MALPNEHQLQMEREEHDHDLYAKRVVNIEVVPTSPISLNPSYTVTRTYAAPIYTTVIQKVINGTTYTKTIVKNTTTNVETISAWS